MKRFWSKILPKPLSKKNNLDPKKRAKKGVQKRGRGSSTHRDAIQLEYERIACRRLELVHPADLTKSSAISLHLGTFSILASSEATDAVIEHHLARLRAWVQDLSRSLPSLPRLDDNGKPAERSYVELERELAAKAVLSFHDYERYVGKKSGREIAKVYQAHPSNVRTMAISRLYDLDQTYGLRSGRKGYHQYLKHVSPKLYRRLTQLIPAHVPEKPRTEHSYFVATTGTGKSELMKAMLLNYVGMPSYCSVVVLDPGGDVVKQVAMWDELADSDRLVYIDPFLSDDHVPVINPFDAEGLNENQKDRLTGQIFAAIGSFTEGKLGGAISAPMEAVLYPSIRLLIELPNTSLEDLLKLMKGDEALVEAGRRSEDNAIADFFLDEFDFPNLKLTRQSIATKLRTVLGKGALNRVLCGRTSIDLEQALSQNKIILVGLSKALLDEVEVRAFGLLFISTVQAICIRRGLLEEHVRPMTHMFVDECHNFATPALRDIIRETRKYGLAVTLMQQEVGGDMDSGLTRTVTETANVKVSGRTDGDNIRKAAALAKVEPHEIEFLPKGSFAYRNGNVPPFILAGRTDRLQKKGASSRISWAQMCQRQIERYYRPRDEAWSDAQTDHDDADEPIMGLHDKQVIITPYHEERTKRRAAGFRAAYRPTDVEDAEILPEQPSNLPKKKPAQKRKPKRKLR